MSEIKKSTYDRKHVEFLIAAGMNKLYDKSPFYFYFLTKIPKYFSTSLPFYAGVGIDSGESEIKLILNPEKLKDFTPDDMQILLEHEILHVCYEHLKSLPKYSSMNKQMQMNMAQDYLINDFIEPLKNRYTKIKQVKNAYDSEIKTFLEKKYNTTLSSDPEKVREFVQSMKLDETQSKELQKELDIVTEPFLKEEPFFNACVKPHIEHIPEIKKLGDFKETTSLEIHNALFKNKKNKSGNGEGEAYYEISFGKPHDDHSQLKEIEENAVNAKVKEILKEAAKDALERAKNIGNVPGDLKRLLTDLFKTKTNYVQILNSFVSSIRDSESRRTWTRRHRKYPFQVPGRKVEFKPNVLFAIDTSGSMWDEKVQKMIATELKALSQVCDHLWIVTGDTKETERFEIKDGKLDLSKLKFKGGGGTDLQFIFNAAKDLGVDGVLVQTDGYFDAVQDHGFKSMFFIYPGGQKYKPEKYRNILMEDC